MDYTRLVELYKDWNGKINVISRKDSDNIYPHHILHSLAISEYMRRFHPDCSWEGARILDLGTGGGFPGIPLAMEHPEAEFVLCDSIGKKITVAAAVAEAMELKNVRCVNARAESLGEDFDYVVTRAVATLSTLYPWVKGRYRKSMLCLKGGDVETEISEFLRKSGLDRRNVAQWRISEWLEDDYFSEKFVIEVGKAYICPPVL